MVIAADVLTVDFVVGVKVRIVFLSRVAMVLLQSQGV